MALAEDRLAIRADAFQSWAPRSSLRWLPRVFTNNPSYLAYDTKGNLVTLSLRFGSRNSPISLPM